MMNKASWMIILWLVGTTIAMGVDSYSTQKIKGAQQFEHQAADPATPGSGSNAVKVFAKSKKLYKAVDDGSGTAVISEVGSGAGGAGEINYVTQSNFEDNTVTGWVRYFDTAGVVPLDAASGSPNITFAVNTSGPLNGLVDAKFAKDAANRQGEGVAYSFKLPVGFRSQMNKVQLTYRTTAGYDVATEGVSVFIYNVDSNLVIYPNGYSATNPPRLPYTLAGGTIGFGWLPSNTTDDDYRLVLHTGLAGTAAFDLFVDEVITGPGSLVQGAAVGDWQSYTPTFANLGTNTLVYAKYRRVGDSAEVMVRTNVTGTGSAAAVTISLPTGLTIGVSKYGGGSSVAMLGVGEWLTATPAVIPLWISGSTSTSVVGIYRTDGTGAALNGDSPANTHTLWFKYTVPIAEWSSSVYLSSGADNSVSGLNWTSYTPTGGWSSSYAGYYGKWRRVGDSVEIEGSIDVTNNAVSGNLSVTLPAGLVIDTAKLGLTPVAGTGAFGVGTLYGSEVYPLTVLYKSTTDFYLAYGDDSATGVKVAVVTGAAPEDLVSTNKVHWKASFPIVGWTWADYAGKITVGFLTAKVGSAGLVNNDASNTGGTPIKGATDGSSATAGYVGEFKENAASDTCTTSVTNYIASITLTEGRWLVSGSLHTGASTLTDFAGRMSVLGATPSVYGKDILSGTVADGGSVTFPSRMVHVATADATKTIRVGAITIGADGTVYGYVSAVRMP